MFVDGEPAPPTIAGLKAEADAVVLVTYSGQQRTIACSSPCIVSSLHAFEIRDILKSHPALASGRRRFVLKLLGGVDESSESVTRVFVYGRSDLVRGHRYVVFARRHRDAWIPVTGNAAGSDSIYDVSGDRVISLSARDWNNTAPSLSRTFLEALRRH
jgi:hypothetical protein